MAIIGSLSINASTGETLTASSDLELAWKWAEVEVNANPDLPGWDQTVYGERCAHVAAALAELQRAYADAGGV